MKVHAVRTGSVRVHERQRSGKGAGIARFVRTLLDDQWTEPLPIYAWVIEHPEGLILVDTGETSRTSRRGYFPRWHPYYRLGVRASVEPDDELGPSLRRLGIDPDDIRWTVMTHLHTDHAGGLEHVTSSQVLVSRAEYASARGLVGKLRGYLPHRWPAGFDPTLVDFEGALGPFPDSLPLTEAGDVHLVSTPGHTAGHLSVVVRDDDHDLFLAGDTSYTQANLLTGQVDGVSSMGAGEGAAGVTLARIRAYAAERPTVYLPSHDPEASDRLTARSTVPMEARPSVKAA
jgi:glyoxylase-like metal-dependent hydrolase (beta-lactamase superfamily II)